MNSPAHSRSRGIRAAFSLIELLVVVAIISILAALLIPTCHTGDKSRRTKCLFNIKTISLGVYTYAAEDRDRLPVMQHDNWICDMPVAVAGALLTNGVARENFYDPFFSEMSAMWDSGINAPHPYRATGYAMTFPGTASLIQTNENPALVHLGTLNPVPPGWDPSRRVLVAGAVISAPGQTNVEDRTLNHYTGIQGRSSLKLRAAHLDSAGKLPTGDNVAMLDGSARWRKFVDMTPRTQGASPVFWW